MKKVYLTPEDYINQVEDNKKDAFIKLRNTIKTNIPKGFEECISYNMIGYVVPLKIFPDGYHCNPSLPLPFINIASQKNYISLYHLGIYGNKNLLDWFISEYSKINKSKLDIGKSCIRFKQLDKIPFLLIAELIKKISLNEWIEYYKNNLQK